ncbi:MAG TPA: hypothetical protein VNT75_28170 [Symbiobacteriaceae bacterium]|nr:hypothetical protein [Symbiobacteriaceae bacterium]
MHFVEFRAAVFQLFRTRRFEEALALIDRERANHPGQIARIGNWRAILFAALGQPDKGLVALQEAVAGGAWYSTRIMEQDETMKPIRELPEFQDLLAICGRRQAEAQATTKPELVVQFDAAAPTPAPMVLALHGNMACAAASVYDWAPAVAQGCFTGLAQSSQIEGPDMYVWDDWEKAQAEVREHYRSLAENPAVDRSRTVLGGFSMGGGTVARMALEGALPVRGFLAVGPYIPDMEPLRAALAGARERGIRGYILIGAEDQICRDYAQGLFDLMRSHDVPVEVEVIPDLGHAYPPDFAERFARAMAFILQP